MIGSFVGIEQQHTFASAVTVNWEGSPGPWTWECGQEESSLHLNCHSYSKIVGVSGCTAMARASESKCSTFLACLHLPNCHMLCLMMTELVPAPASWVFEEAGSTKSIWSLTKDCFSYTISFLGRGSMGKHYGFWFYWVWGTREIYLGVSVLFVWILLHCSSVP